jgi:hypothetical protein
MTLSIINTQHNNVVPCAECWYAECRILFTIMLSVIMLSVIMLSVVAPSSLQLSDNSALTNCFRYGQTYASRTES